MPKASRKFDVDCRGCHRRFTAGTPRAVWCSDACKKRHARATREAKAAEDRAASVPEHDLVRVVRAELAKAGKAETVDGLLAVHLALAVAAAESAGKVGPEARLRIVLAAAVGREVVEEPEVPAVDVPDELDEIRARRARAAAG